MLRVVPTSIFSWDFRVFQGDREVGLLDHAAVRERATFRVKDVAFSLHRESLLGDFVLVFEGAVLARAAKPSALTRRFELTFQERAYVLKAESALTRAFELLDGEEVVGRIRPEGMFTRKATVDLPEALPLPVQVFAFWLALLMWRRAQQSSS